MLYIFDWDGTLCNSLNTIVTCTQAAAEEMGLARPTDEAVKDIIGLSLPKAIDRVFPGITEPQFKELLTLYSKHFSSITASPMDFYPGVKESLEHLLEAGHELAVATGKSRRGLDRVLKEMGVEPLFAASRCADETRSKPHPQMLVELIDHFGVSADQAVMVGDTEYDMAMAQGLDMPRIAVSYGAHTIERLIPYKPVLCMDNFDEITRWTAKTR